MQSDFRLFVSNLNSLPNDHILYLSKPLLYFSRLGSTVALTPSYSVLFLINVHELSVYFNNINAERWTNNIAGELNVILVAFIETINSTW